MNLPQLNLMQVDLDNKLPSKLRQDLCIYKLNELESTFTEIINLNKQISSLLVYIDIQQ